MHKHIIAIVLTLLLTACVTAPPKTIYGQAPTYDQQAVKASILDVLIDPMSARFEFGEPKRAWKLGVLGGYDWTGYLAIVWVNAKNRMGGYTGDRPFYVMLSDGSMQLHGPEYVQRARLRYADGSDVPRTSLYY